MAEGWARHLTGDQFEVFSAGTAPTGLRSLAVQAMKERGIDISAQHSKSLAEVPSQADYVISLCAEADAACPTLPVRRLRLAWHLPDPAAASGTAEQKLDAFRAVRDEIERRLRDFFAREKGNGPPAVNR